MAEPKSLYYTEKEFEEIREEISEIAKIDILSEHFVFSKSSYKWSSLHNFEIIIDVRSKWSDYRYKDVSVRTKAEVIKTLLDAVVDFVENNKRCFTFIDFRNAKSYFSFSFSFQPTVLRAKTLLERT